MRMSRFLEERTFAIAAARTFASARCFSDASRWTVHCRRDR
jgi:hypothetical protein